MGSGVKGSKSFKGKFRDGREVWIHCRGFFFFLLKYNLCVYGKLHESLIIYSKTHLVLRLVQTSRMFFRVITNMQIFVCVEEEKVNLKSPARLRVGR